ncbi:MAG: hypothetical protein ACWGPS_07235 [Candidatus Promineifilaceae bacterium]
MSSASPAPTNRVRLIDRSEGPGRTTASLLASLAARLAALYSVSGADAIGSIAAGFGALGREVGRTAQGARLRKAIEAGRPGANGDALWRDLRIGDWLSSMPPSPILDQLRNDLALLLADDLEATLELMPIPNPMAGTEGSESIAPVTFVDCLLGLWAFSTELACAVEALAAPNMPTSAATGEVVVADHPDPEPESSLLR